MTNEELKHAASTRMNALPSDMRTPLPKIEDVRKVSEGRLNAEVEAQRESVIAGILSSTNSQCVIDSHVYHSIQRELIAAGYIVYVSHFGFQAKTTIQW